jgi:3-hydroxy-9,10-secoandrosta-1,3,5(10)-triene-9,17-dione monooxygenase reductase component
MIYEKEYFVAGLVRAAGEVPRAAMPKRRREAAADRASRAAARASRVQKSGGFAESYLSYLLARASHTVASGFHAKLKTWKLSVPEYRVLLCLAGADGLGVGDLAAMAIMAQPRMTKLLDRMQRQGLVGRHPDRNDRRRVLIHLTASGRARAAPVLRAAKAHEARLLAPFTAEERGAIKRALDLLINGRA